MGPVESGLLRQVVSEDRFKMYSQRGIGTSNGWSLSTGGLSTQVVFRTGLTVLSEIFMSVFTSIHIHIQYANIYAHENRTH